jgi:hypothetical protein
MKSRSRDERIGKKINKKMNNCRTNKEKFEEVVNRRG